MYNLTREEQGLLRSLDILMQCFCQNYRAVKQDYVKTVKDSVDEDERVRYYEFIPNGIRDVGRRLIQVKKYLKNNKMTTRYESCSKFLDVGAGNGNIMAIAEAIGYYASGIEYDEEYRVITSRHMQDNIYYKDAFDFTEYNKYNVIYLYQPIYSPDEMTRLLKYINKKAKKDTIVISFMPDVRIKHPKNWERIIDNHGASIDGVVFRIKK